MPYDAKRFFEDFASGEVGFLALPQSGSARRNYIGSTSQQKYIITQNTDIRENEAFFYFTELFASLGLNTPQIFKISADKTLYIQQFLGAHTLSDIINEEQESESVRALVKKSLERLFLLQTKTQGRVDYTRTFEYESYDRIPITHDLFYFKFMFADILEAHYHKSKLIKEFNRLAEKIEALSPKGLMIRDFQARNIMVDENDEVFFIDYQSAMYGPLMYDVVSFLYQVKANFSDEFKREMIEYYLSFWQEEQSQLRDSVGLLSLIRSLQVLGAYGFRGLVQKKAHFINSIGRGLSNLYKISEDWQGMKDFPELKSVINQISTKEIKLI